MGSKDDKYITPPQNTRMLKTEYIPKMRNTEEAKLRLMDDIPIGCNPRSSANTDEDGQTDLRNTISDNNNFLARLTAE